MAGILKIKRVYEPEAADDGKRILVDRLWPRGESKVRADLSGWAKEAAPWAEERKAFHEGKEDFAQFRDHYLKQLDASDAARELKEQIAKDLLSGNVTLVYGSKNETENNAQVLYEWLAKQL